MKNLIIFSILTAISILITSLAPLPDTSSDVFAGAGVCQFCHEGSGNVLTYMGADISPVTQWRSTMMANSNKDPLFRAVVSQEVHKNPALKETIENTCNKCHSPMGYYEAKLAGNVFTMDSLKNNQLVRDGVSCTLCHQVTNENFGMPESYTGGYIINSNHDIYGPYPDPFGQPMINMSGYAPVYSEHIHRAELCGTCHTLFTPVIDEDGNIAGEFAEQTPYLEWKNSFYAQNQITCQKCHMPGIDEPVDIASLPPWENTLRSPYAQHHFAGSNFLMQKLFRDNLTEMGLSAEEQHFDSTFARTMSILEKSTVDVSLDHQYIDENLIITVKLVNKSGHKLPAGIPLRRLWIRLTITDENENIIFESGNWDKEGRINGLDDDYEPHYDLIDDDSKVQIYEGVMMNLKGEVTNILLEAGSFKKDNRIPPKGFLKSGPDYEHTKIYGLAEDDPNFNNSGGQEGSGSDEVRYSVGIPKKGNYTVHADICMQTIKTEMLDHLFETETEEINYLKSLWSKEYQEPMVITANTLNVKIGSGVKDDKSRDQGNLKINPNPVKSDAEIIFYAPSAGNFEINIASLSGELIKSEKLTLKPGINILDFSMVSDKFEIGPGAYFLILNNKNRRFTAKFIYLP